MNVIFYIWKDGDGFIDSEGRLTTDPRSAKVLGSWQQAYTFKRAMGIRPCTNHWELFRVVSTLEKDEQ